MTLTHRVRCIGDRVARFLAALVPAGEPPKSIVYLVVHHREYDQGLQWIHVCCACDTLHSAEQQIARLVREGRRKEEYSIESRVVFFAE